MKLYHFSQQPLATLRPAIGPNRHGGEGAASNIPVVWLTSYPESRVSAGGQFFNFRHEVEIDLKDPRLSVDEEVADGIRAFGPQMGISADYPPPWYFYAGELAVERVAEYNAESGAWTELDPLEQ